MVFDLGYEVPILEEDKKDFRTRTHHIPHPKGNMVVESLTSLPRLPSPYEEVTRSHFSPNT